MKLTLIQPSVGKIANKPYIKSWTMEPLALATLAGLTPKEFEVELIDERIDELPEVYDTDVVGITVETYTAKRAYSIAKEIRRQGVKVIMGGIHVNLMPDEVMKHCDSMLVGGAEGGIWTQILNDFKNNKLQKKYDANSYFQKELEHVTPRRDLYANKGYLPLGLVESGRGCPFTCEFCAIASAHKGKYRYKLVDKIIEDINNIPQKMLYFADDNFVSKFSRTKELCDAMAPLNKKWFSHGTINMANQPELLKKLQKSGCSNLLIGFESLNEDTLKSMGKSWAVVKRGYAESIKILRDYGISIYGTFVFGYDQDKPEDIEKTLEFAIEQKMCLAAFNHLVPYPGTPLYTRFEKEGRLIDKEWWLKDGYNFGEVSFSPKNFTPQELSKKCYDARMDFYKFSNILKRVEFNANCRDPFSDPFQALAFMSANFVSQKGIKQRQNWPIGNIIDKNGKILN